MLKNKSQLLQIRLEPELLSQFKVMSEERGVHVSLMLRHLMTQSCEQYAESKRKKLQFEQRKAERQR